MTSEEKKYYNKGRQFFLDNPTDSVGVDNTPFIWTDEDSDTNNYNVAYCEGYKDAHKEYFEKLYKIEQLKADLNNIFTNYDVNFANIDDIMFEKEGELSHVTNLSWNKGDGFYP